MSILAYHLFHFMWFECIRSCTKNPSHKFLANRWLVHNWFVNLGNLLEVVVCHLLIGGLIGLSYRDEFPMVSTLVCMVTRWTLPIVSWSYITYGLDHYWWKPIAIGILNRGHDISWDWDRVSYWVIIRRCVYGTMTIVVL